MCLILLISFQVDIAYVPFIERFQIFFSGIKNYDITKGRPNLQKFIEVIQNDGT
jgi:glutathione S-transferase